MSAVTRMTSLARALLAVVAVLVTSGLYGCSERDGLPPLVEVLEVTPRALEAGDRVEIRGGGFPQGRPARITFRGTLLRPGQPETHGAAVEAEGVVMGSDRIEVVVGDLLEEGFCGHGDHASHTTMNGDVEVAFASSIPGAPPLVGVKRGISLDVIPSSVRGAVTESRKKEGERLLAFLGITPGPASPRGIPIEQIAVGLPAERAGFQAGDVLTGVDGVHVRDLDDLMPASARSARFTLRHGESGTEETKSVALVGYASERIPVEYGPALVVVGLALAILLFLVLPAPIAASELELRIARKLRGTRSASILLALVGRGPRAIASVLTSVLVSTFALGPHVIGPELDGAVLLVTAIALLVASRVASARGFMGSLRAIGEVAAFGLVLVLAVLGMILQGGAYHLAELVRGQGGLPWQFAAARHPVGFVLAFLYVGTLLALLRARDDRPLLSDVRLDDADVAAAPKSPRASSPPAGVMLERLGLFVACALGVAIFFGGWQLPGAQEARTTFRDVLAAVLFVTKTWGLTALLLGASALASPWSPRQMRSFALRRVLPGVALAALLLLVSRRLGPSDSLELAGGATVVTAAALLGLRTVLRIRAAMVRPEPHASPFL